jgi:integrase
VSIHAERRKNGRRYYKVRFREGGVNRSRSFDRHADARAFEAELRRRRQLGTLAVQQLIERHGPTLGEWVELRWAVEHAALLAQSTRDRYADVWRVHVEPTLGPVPLAEITVGRLRAWQVELLRAGVGVGTIDKARTLLSSVLRHAAEAEAIPANPLSLVRAPAAEQRDAVVPLSPAVIERIREAMLHPQPRHVAASGRRRRYELPAPGTPQTNQRDALIVSLLGYAGLRPGELRGLPLAAVGESTINVQRACNPDGSIKRVKGGERRSVRLLAPLAQDLREFRLAAGRPPERSLILGAAWTKSEWQMWRVDRWAPACRAVGLDPVPRPYHLRHSFASLLLAEGRQPTYVAKQLGHSVAVLLRTYAHLIDEFEGRERVDAEAEIWAARKTGRSLHVPSSVPGLVP